MNVMIGHNRPRSGRMYAITCVLATQDLARKFPWFRPSGRDMRMLRIEENNDLGPAIEQTM